MHLAGPFLVGLATAGVPFQVAPNLQHAFFLVYFLLPANIFLYGLCDAADADTEAMNPKKNSYEVRLEKRGRMIAVLAGLVLQIPLLLIAHTLPHASLPYLVAFLFLAVIHSLPPIRLKARPFLDSASNVLYALPGFFGYILAGGTSIPFPIIVAAFAWCVAMHAWRAIPDIEADANAGLSTTATMLGGVWTLRLCLFLFVLAAALSFPWLGYTAVAAGAIYAVVTIATERVSDETRFLIYTRFPRMNILIGFAITLQIIASQLK